MICNGTRPHIFVVFFLIIVLLHTSTCQQKLKQKQKDYDEDNNGLVGTKGDLYEVFKKRLEKFNSEMSLNKDGLFDEKPAKTNIADEKRSTVRECLYEEYKKRLDKINNELSLDGEKVFDRSGRNIEKDNNAGSGANIGKSKVEDGSQAIVEDSLARTKPANNVIKKNAVGVNQDITSFKEMDEKPQHKASERKACIKNYGLRKLQPAVYASEETVNKITENKVHAYDSESAQKDLKVENLIMPTIHSNIATITLPTNNDVNFKDDASNIHRRQAESSVDNSETDLNIRDMSAELIPTDLSPSYPNVLTKGLNTDMISGTHAVPSTLLNSVASKLKTSPLDLAKKLATATDGSANIKNDPKLTKLLQKYIENSVNLNSSGRTTKDTAADAALTESLCMPQDLPHYQVTSLPPNSQIPQLQPQPQPQAQCPLPGPVQTLEYNSVSNILEKVLTKLEQIQEAKPDNLSDKFCEVEGAPCEILGTWNSYIMGLRFGIKTSSGNGKKRLDAKYPESENLVLSIDVQETNPPKLHQIMDTGWKFTGSAMKQIGGPFFIISETKTQNVLATFAGYCRTCGSIDTIFGSWTFVFPSKDCQDISVAIENKRDIFRRDLLDAKIGERYNSVSCDKPKKPKCMTKQK